MTVYELARELGNKMLESDEGKRMADARYIFDGNKEAQAQLFNYSNYKAALQEKYNNGTLNEEELANESVKLGEMMEELKKNPIITDMLDAETEFSVMVNQVMSILNATITGNEGNGCSGSCASCGGCH
jgi:cell fate (sporulation/competence/biofilm development) regulator YlbF (YheA/YmcA/DUF963 family)